MKVFLNDSDLSHDAAYRRFYEAATWAHLNCSSYYGLDVVDVSDFSTRYDTVAEYRFYDDKDATLFALRWK